MQSFEASGVVTAFEKTGHGEPIVLLHGGEADHSMFDGLAPVLAANFTVIAYDQRDSGTTRNPASAYSLADLADDAAALITGLGYDRVHVFGTSLGGQIAQVLAARHPGRIDRLILSSTWKVNRSPLDVNAEAFRTLASWRADTAGNAPKIAEFFFPPDYLRTRPELIDIFRGSSRDEGQKARRGALLAQPVAADLTGFDRPTLLLVGSDDRLIPNPETFALARDLASVEMKAIADAGHVASIQAPERVAEAVTAFLNSNKKAA
ncbi:pimeloyl-ACP methyl ester carboxylesterase [Bradyrhizobium japonicum]|jgi:3-oxoadipate enol-lactonase|uniref:Pimeloyl-ACP methyl ester carboxylesterase n=1 Tax=Bradyrhizobium elkanii TaxID=29448 RepID=A0ABV4F8C7_BRAEL|nr:alpha/beta hydrolase [Bradyrhizobium elkanii]MBP2433247.1 3-oxoadipate enol-lactonase [Bradyrhizobium elkanii]MCP1733433.1 3-oxoadipate enol-lactonase [Bradyrhizobium elkanii]MCP1751100.1 3-oxoadipate enol-lactonase [Bradyrhizobium elkanii]MCP1967589.1 3-oxoadipate enol-lactonase [Bradyrhizobium elkanii]MCP1976872.1 3-oxoadipate enol-lactonase [Bradyrhizobium elkanii]